MCELCSKIHLNNFAFLLEAGHGTYEKMHLIFDTKFPRKREKERERERKKEKEREKRLFLIEFREQHERINFRADYIKRYCRKELY